MSATFKTPELAYNPDGWGPLNAEPEKFKNMPFAMFNKTDKLGKAVDWLSAPQQTYKQQGKLLQNASVGYIHEEDDAFKVVDRPGQSRQRQGTNYKRTFNQTSYYKRPQFTKGQQQRNMPKGKAHQYKRFHSQSDRYQRVRQASVEVKSDWTPLEQYTLSSLNKVTADVPQGTTVKACGFVNFYDKTYDRVTTKNDKPLVRSSKAFFRVSTSDDPLIREFAAEGAAQVFATDAIVSQIMAAPRTVSSWDIVIQKVGGVLFFDKRDGSTIDMLTVNETAHDPPAEDSNSINSMSNLSEEATFVNQNFSQQVLTKQRHQFGEPNPFQEEDVTDDEIAATAYHYRKFELENGATVIIRCEVDAVVQVDNPETGPSLNLMTLKALNEADNRYNIDWKTKLDVQHGAVLANELKNNAAKFAKWTAQALVADTQLLKLGYVSRVAANNRYEHVVLRTQVFKPEILARQLNLYPANMWGIFQQIVNRCLKLEDGKYVLLKDPNKPQIRIYEVPADAFDEVTEGGDDESVVSEVESEANVASSSGADVNIDEVAISAVLSENLDEI